MFDQRYIAALTKWEDLEVCLQSKISTVFLLCGSLMDLPNQVYILQKNRKKVFLHVDLIQGLNCNTNDGMSFIKENIAPDGIISTKGQTIRTAKRFDLVTIQRIFLIDSQALSKAIETCHKNGPDAVEAMPGLMPSIIEELTKKLPFPIVGGGLFKTVEDIGQAIDAGATAISSGNPELWMKLNQEM